MVEVVDRAISIVMEMEISMSMIMKISCNYNQSKNIHHISFNFRFNDLTIVGVTVHSLSC